jgi:hypothetical protein
MVCTVRKVKKEGPTQNRLFYCCPQIDSCGFFECKEIEPRVTKTGFVLFSDPLQYRYKNEDTGETFTSTNIYLMLRKRMKNFLRNMNNRNKTK